MNDAMLGWQCDVEVVDCSMEQATTTKIKREIRGKRIVAGNLRLGGTGTHEAKSLLT